MAELRTLQSCPGILRPRLYRDVPQPAENNSMALPDQRLLPATWNFMLAARARGLGTCWTTLHRYYEKEAAALLGIPYEEVMQVALIPVAYTLGTTFRPAHRHPIERVLHWNRW